MAKVHGYRAAENSARIGAATKTIETTPLAMGTIGRGIPTKPIKTLNTAITVRITREVISTWLEPGEADGIDLDSLLTDDFTVYRENVPAHGGNTQLSHGSWRLDG